MNKNTNNFWNNEQGGVALASVLVIYGFAVLIAFVFNTGHDIIRKNEAQNAADAMAYSSGVVLARSLNTVSALNHCVGELTAICVVLDAIAGQENDTDYITDIKKTINSPFGVPIDLPASKTKAYSKIEASYNDIIAIKNVAAPFPGIEQIDKEIVDMVRKLMAMPDPRNTFAAIYDADMMLKYYTAQCMRIKNLLHLVGKIVQWVPIVGQAINGGITLISLSVTGILCYDIATEHAVLIALDKAAIHIPEMTTSIKKTVIPLICDYMAQYTEPENNPVAVHLENVLNTLQQDYRLREFAISPSVSALKLPLEKESIENKNGYKKSLKSPESPWTGNDEKASTALEVISGIMKTFDRVVSGIRPLVTVASALTEAFGGDSPFSEFTDALKSLKSMDKFDKKGVPDSPSRKNLNENKFDVDYEQRTQLVRATNPYVDHLRSGIRTWCKKPLSVSMNNSNLSTFFTHWTYRYTLVESYNLHHGKNGKSTKNKENKLLVLKNSVPEKKGYEPWTTDASEADQLFTIIAAVQIKQRLTGIADHLFKQPNKNDDTVIAQVIVYPAGGRDMDDNKNEQPNTNEEQPNTGWDTLQWTMSPNIIAPEWWAQASPRGNRIDLLKLFTGIKIDSESKAAVKLNWQAKLTPITATKLELLSNEEETQNSEPIKETTEFLLKNNNYNILNH
ncbi:MAG: Tad domain-containing protein [Planctomycetaceae bacterium]|nr:Tad domain-containing protein [Planctomycetaceae bacterium]